MSSPLILIMLVWVGEHFYFWGAGMFSMIQENSSFHMRLAFHGNISDGNLLCKESRDAFRVREREEIY